MQSFNQNYTLKQAATSFGVSKEDIINTLEKKGFNITNEDDILLSSEMFKVLGDKYIMTVDKSEEWDKAYQEEMKRQVEADILVNNSFPQYDDSLDRFYEDYYKKQDEELKKEVKDIETEDNEEMDIEIPFNPNDIKVRTQHLNIGDLVDRLEHNEIKMDTEFQRLAHLWNDTKKSRFIESLLLRLPIPTFYFDESDDNQWRVIDGLQRISTLESFITLQDLKLEKLEFLKQYEGKTFDELPRDLQRRIKTFSITTYVLEKGTPDVVKYTLFRRINQGGLVLTPQEIRHAIHQGIASELVAELVNENTKEGQSFIQATEGKVKSKRMEDRDFATRFVSFYLIDYKEYRPDLDSFMNRGMTAIKNLTKEEIERLKSDFKKAMDTAFDIFGDDAFRKRMKKDDYRKPINKAIFEIVSVNFAKLHTYQTKKLIEKKELFKEKFMALHNQEDEKFMTAISRSTAQRQSVEDRFEAIEKIISQTLND